MFIANKVGISLEGEYLETTSLKGTDANPGERSASTRENMYRLLNTSKKNNQLPRIFQL
jgi:hypothetical protein